MAGVGSPLWAVTQSGVRADGTTYTNVLFFNGGMGATANKDGESVLSWPSNISSTPVEVAERNSPLFFHYKRLRPGSGGQGRFRGGLGQDMLMESESASPIAMVFMAERTTFGAPGFAGGVEGGRGDVRINGQSINHRRQHILKLGDYGARAHTRGRRLRPGPRARSQARPARPRARVRARARSPRLRRDPVATAGRPARRSSSRYPCGESCLPGTRRCRTPGS